MTESPAVCGPRGEEPRDSSPSVGQDSNLALSSPWTPHGGRSTPTDQPTDGLGRTGGTEMSEELSGHQVLDTPMQPNDADDSTVRDYLIALLAAVWDEGEGFSGKHPFGNSGWEWDLHAALAKAGHIEGKFDDDGYIVDVDEEKGRALISQAIQALGAHGTAGPEEER